MSDKYSIDDILNEIDKKRSGGEGSQAQVTESVTEIIGGNELDKAMRSSGLKTRMTDDERKDEEEREQREQQERAENIRAAAERKKEALKQKKLDFEEKRRLEREERRRIALERKNEQERAKKEPSEQKKRGELPEDNGRENLIPQEKPEETAAEIAEEHSGNTAELSTPVEASKLFEPHEQSGSDSLNNDDIIFHSEVDLAAMEQIKLRKKKRIEEINRALLRVDRSAQEPEELVESLNPMDSRQKAVEDVIRSEEKEQAQEQNVGDTLSVSGNDLKRMAGKESDNVKEYSPVTSRKKQRDAEDILFTPGAQKKKSADDRGSEALIASLNQKLKEQREKNIAEGNTLDFAAANENAAPQDMSALDYADKVIDTGILPKTDPVAAVREAEALAARKKRRISSFMLQDIEDEDEQELDAGEEAFDEEEPDEVLDLDDEGVIAERLKREEKGLCGRLVLLVILALAAGFLTVHFEFFRNNAPITGDLAGLSVTAEYIYGYLILGIFSFGACSSVVSSGFSRLIKGKPDGDTLCAMAHIGSLGALILYLVNTNNLTMKQSFVYVLASLLSLCFNTISKLCTVRAAKNNFRFVSGDNDKYYAECLVGEQAEQLARGAVKGYPVLASLHKTEMLCDILISTYCEDISDRISRILTPVIAGAAVIGGAIGFFTAENVTNIMYQWSQAATVFTAVLCVGASFTGAMTVMLPMLSASRKNSERRAAILGYSAVEDFSEVNAVLTEAKSLFPTGSVTIRNIWDYNKNGRNGSQRVTIDEAIIFAASLAVAADSILADSMFSMLNYHPELLKKVSGCVYESSMGVSGWIGSRRILLGSRELMKSHGIVVPDSKKESSLNKFKDEVVYLAVAGEVCMLFFVSLSANPQVKSNVKRLAKNGVSIIIKTVDGALSVGALAELFDISPEYIKILPAEAHSSFEEHTKYTGKGSAAVSCDGTFSSLAAAINSAKAVRERISWGCIMEIAGISLGVLLIFIFTIFRNYSMLNSLWISAYNLICLALTVLVMQIRRI